MFPTNITLHIHPVDRHIADAAVGLRGAERKEIIHPPDSAEVLDLVGVILVEERKLIARTDDIKFDASIFHYCRCEGGGGGLGRGGGWLDGRVKKYCLFSSLCLEVTLVPYPISIKSVKMDEQLLHWHNEVRFKF